MRASVPALESLRRPAWLPATVWPFEAKALAVDDALIAVAEAGRGPTLVFYTGIGSSVWRDVIVRLSDRFHCVTLDPPGIGLSGPVPRSQATLRQSARAVEGVIDALDLRDIVLVVHDTAGPAALAAAGRAPSRIRGLVGVNTFGWHPTNGALRAMLAVMGSSVMRQFSLATGALARLTASPFGVGRHLDAVSRRAYREGLQVSMRTFHDYLNDARKSDIFDEVADALAGPLSCLPLLTIFGERNDPFGFQRQWKARYPDARQLVIRGGNHFPMCDAPDFVADQIRRWHQEHVGAPQERQS